MREIVNVALQLMNKEAENLPELPPILAMFGDSVSSRHKLPSFQKARFATTLDGLEYITSKDTGLNCTKGVDKELYQSRKELIVVQPPDHLGQERVVVNSGIIWPFNYNHHFGSQLFEDVRRFDITWESKKNVGVWRGAPNGIGFIPKEQRYPFTNFCEHLPRCRLVNIHRNSPLLDVGFTGNRNSTEEYDIPDDFYKDPIYRKDHFQYKAIIIIEGNDVATGLKWALYSRSVVLMPTPRRMSYAMEEWLEPWIHYIPITIHKDEEGRTLGNGTVSDVEEKMQWVLDNDEDARKIAERATLFMHDLLFDPDHSEKENMKLKEMIMERYFNFFAS